MLNNLKLKTMTFSDAFTALQNGATLTRHTWKQDEFVFYFSPVANGLEVISIDGKGEYPLKPFFLQKRESCVSPYMFSNEDLLADDWYVI
jgi:hypothetical protein